MLVRVMAGDLGRLGKSNGFLVSVMVLRGREMEWRLWYM